MKKKIEKYKSVFDFFLEWIVDSKTKGKVTKNKENKMVDSILSIGVGVNETNLTTLIEELFRNNKNGLDMLRDTVESAIVNIGGVASESISTNIEKLRILDKLLEGINERLNGIETPINIKYFNINIIDLVINGIQLYFTCHYFYNYKNGDRNDDRIH